MDHPHQRDWHKLEQTQPRRWWQVREQGGAAFADARKSATTDGLTNAASMIGIGHQVFKGLVRPGKTRGNDKKLGHGADSTAFWSLYRKEAKKVGMSLDGARGLVNKDNWTAACTELRTFPKEGGDIP